MLSEPKAVRDKKKKINLRQLSYSLPGVNSTISLFLYQYRHFVIIHTFKEALLPEEPPHQTTQILNSRNIFTYSCNISCEIFTIFAATKL